MIIDLHVHTRHYSGCSSIEAADLVRQSKTAGLDGVILTEHGILWPEEKLALLREEAAKQNLLILAGQEVTCLEKGRRQDFLVFGLSESLGAGASARDLIDRVHDRGGVVVAAHPFKPSRLGVGYHGAGDDIYSLDLDGVELQHPDHNEEARKKVETAAKTMGLPMTGGSDAHELDQVGSHSTYFQNPVRTIEEAMAEIRSGRVKPVNGFRGG